MEADAEIHGKAVGSALGVQLIQEGGGIVWVKGVKIMMGIPTQTADLS